MAPPGAGKTLRIQRKIVIEISAGSDGRLAPFVAGMGTTGLPCLFQHLAFRSRHAGRAGPVRVVAVAADFFSQQCLDLLVQVIDFIIQSRHLSKLHCDLFQVIAGLRNITRKYAELGHPYGTGRP